MNMQQRRKFMDNIANPLEVLQKDEQIVFEVRRHPIGLVYIYLGAAFVLITFAVIAFVIGPNIYGDISIGGKFLIGLGFLVIFVAIFVLTLVATIAYWGNHWILSSDSLTQSMQNGLFHRRVAQLSLEHIEDVVADKFGILQHFFNYGTVMVTTASEVGKFEFGFCPDPTRYAQRLLAAREDFMNNNIHNFDKKTPTRQSINRLGRSALKKSTHNTNAN